MSDDLAHKKAWPFNRLAFGFCLNVAVAAYEIFAVQYWLATIFLAFAFACGISQICFTIRSARKP